MHIEQAEKEEKEHFYKQLQDTINCISVTDIMIAMGDFNAKVSEIIECEKK
jgi:hypothetical protein